MVAGWARRPMRLLVAVVAALPKLGYAAAAAPAPAAQDSPLLLPLARLVQGCPSSDHE